MASSSVQATSLIESLMKSVEIVDEGVGEARRELLGHLLDLAP